MASNMSINKINNGLFIYTFNGSNINEMLDVNNSTPSRLMDKYEIKILFAVIMATLCLVTTFGNISVIYRYRKASMVGNLFIISLAIADLIVGVFVMPIATIYAITEVWTMSLPLCMVWLSADYTASTASILNLFTLSLDRYWSITSPLKYLGKRTKSRALLMIAIAWSLSILWVLPITSWSFMFNNGVRYVPADKCNTEYDKNIGFKVATAICNFYLPLLAMITLNAKIYLVIRRRYHNPIMKYSSMSPNNATTGGGGGFSNPDTVPQSSVTVDQQRHSSNLNTLSVLRSDKNRNVSNNNSELYCQISGGTSQTSNLTTQRNRSLSLDITRLNATSFVASQLIQTTPIVTTKNQRHELRQFLKCFGDCTRLTAGESENSIRRGQQEIVGIKQHRSVSSHIRSTRNITNDMCMSKLIVTETKLNTRSTSMEYLEEELDMRKSHLIPTRAGKESSIERSTNANENRINLTTEAKRQRPSQTLNSEVGSNDPIATDVVNSACSNASDIGGGNISPNGTTKLYTRKKRQSGSVKLTNGSGSETKINRKGYMNKQEKAFKQLAAIVIGFTLCFSPYFIVFLIVAICEDCVNANFFTFTVWLGYLNSTLNPFLYALSNNRLIKSSSRNKKVLVKNFNGMIVNNANVTHRSSQRNRTPKRSR